MKSILLYLLFLSSCCYCDKLLGGWSISDDESLKGECLDKALVHIHGAQVNDEIRAQVSDHTCATQIVNGINIKCTFSRGGAKWQCSYYKSFVQTLDIQLEKCEKVTDEPKAEAKGEEQAGEEQAASNEDEEEKQPLIANENEEEEQARVADAEKEKQGREEAPASDNDEEDDEAAIDAMNQKMSEQSANNEEQQ